MEEIRELVDLEDEAVEEVDGEVVDTEEEKKGLSGFAVAGIVTAVTAAAAGAVYGGKKLWQKFRKDREILKKYYEAEARMEAESKEDTEESDEIIEEIVED